MEEVAERRGYSSVAAFAKALKKQTGSTPGMIRRKHRCDSFPPSACTQGLFTAAYLPEFPIRWRFIPLGHRPRKKCWPEALLGMIILRIACGWTLGLRQISSSAEFVPQERGPKASETHAVIIA